jgi:membrane-bound lytic murein transglycosylase D
MLKTQVVKAVSFCLFCSILSSFVPVSPASTPAVPSIALSAERTASSGTKAEISFAPKVKLNKQALLFANHYIRTDGESLIRIRQRSKVPFTIMDSVFVHHGLPVELKYLAVIESELNSTALSCVGAVGPWQLMPETAHDLGLKITTRYDERTNFYKSTKAAALYLKDLYAQFGDWLLVLAAYNSGPGPVIAAIRKSGSRNFWALQDYLPAETRGHVKRFIATEYFFEGHGSVATLTKAENITYTKSLTAFVVARSAATRSATPSSAATALPAAMTNFFAVSHSEAAPQRVVSEKEQKVVSEKESMDDRYKRLMKESEKSLQNSNKAIGKC